MIATALIAVRTAIGITVMALVFILMLWAFPGTTSWNSQGMIPAIVAGVFGGAVCYMLAPLRGIAIALSAGGFLTFCLLGIMFILKLEANGQNLLSFYWPIWFIPASYLGAYLGRYVYLMSRSR